MRAFFKVIALVLCIALILPVCAFAEEGDLTLVTPPSRTVFYEGRDWSYVSGRIYSIGNFDLSGAVVRYEPENVEIPYYVFPWGANMWCEPVSGRWTTGENAVKIFIDDVDGVYTYSTITLQSISKIEVTTPPNKTSYLRGVDWDYDENGNVVLSSAISLIGLELNILYSDGTTDSVTYNKKTDNIIWTIPSDTFSFQPGDNVVNATYYGKNAKLHLDMTLESITKVYVSTPPSKYLYNFGADWKYSRGKISPDEDLTGLIVTAAYNNGTTRDFSYDECPERFALEAGQTYSAGENYVNLTFDGEFPFYFTAFMGVCGDVDIDGTVNSTDALHILKYSVGSEEFDSDQLRYADVNDDGRVSSADALSVLRKTVGLITLFEAEI